MKRFVILLIVALVFSATIAADTSVLIDFAELAADYPADSPAQNTRTMVDFSIVAGSSYSEEEKAQMKTSLYIENWEVILNSSARSVRNQSMSYTREAPVRQGATLYGGETVMGIRVHFPDEPFNAWALVRPPFEIPAYADSTEIEGNNLVVSAESQGRGEKFDGFGVVKNVGVLRSISLNVMGLNFPHTISVILMDQNNQEREYVMGNLGFDGWQTLTWKNPNYVQDVRHRELRTYPLYPNSVPMLKLIGFRIYKDASVAGGDFVTYVKDVSLTYDRAVLSLERDIQDEFVWHILQDREEARRKAELDRLGNQQVLRFLETRKMDDPETLE